MQTQNPVRQVCHGAAYRRQRASPAHARPTRTEAAASSGFGAGYVKG
ncbi:MULTISPECIES: hypothetical protein [Enterobacterales]